MRISAVARARNGVVCVDFVQLTAGAVALLVPLLKRLLSTGQDAAEELGEAVGQKDWSFALTLWGKLPGKIDERPTAWEAVEDVAARSDDPRARAALEWQARKLLEQDADLSEDMQKLHQDAETASVTTATVTASEGRAIAVGGNVSDSQCTNGSEGAPWT